jgi:hypothetical protein
LPWKNNFGRGTIESELVAVPAYRVLLCHDLERTNACGTITLERPGYVRYNIADLNQSGSFGITLPEDLTATNGATAQIRWCDWIAISLASRSNPEELLALRVRSGDANALPEPAITGSAAPLVPLRELVTVKQTITDKSIYHKNLMPVTYVIVVSRVWWKVRCMPF